MRKATINRETNETKIKLTLAIDGTRKINIDTGIPFFDHMLNALAFYANWDLTLSVDGDLQIDDHHTVEDIGIVLGTAFNQALDTKRGITRFSSTTTPMDEALTEVSIDISNRPYLVYNVAFSREMLGTLSTENIKEFFYAFAIEARITLHINNKYGKNNHHVAESIFKGVGRTLKEATFVNNNNVVSTKGVL